MTCSALVLGAALHPVTPAAPVLGGALGIVIGAVIGYGPGVRRLLAGGPTRLVLGALALAVAAWAARRVAGAQETAAWSPIVATAVAAAAMGLIGALAVLPRHLAVVVDPVRAVLHRLPHGLDPEVRSLCDRAAAIWTAAQAQISDETNAQLVRDGVIETLEVAVKCAEVKITGASDAELAERIAELDRRIAAATDADALAQYRAARAALGDQQRYRAEIRQSRERLIARMHSHLAALEKFELAATGLPAARAGASAALEARSHDAITGGDALDEIAM
jgi:hypothetical protein